MTHDTTAKTIAKALFSCAVLTLLAWLATPSGAQLLEVEWSLALPAAALMVAASLAASIASRSAKTPDKHARVLGAVSIAIPLIAGAFELALIFAPALDSVADGRLYLGVLAVFEVVAAIVILAKCSAAPFLRTVLLVLLPGMAFGLAGIAIVILSLLALPFVIRIARICAWEQFR